MSILVDRAAFAAVLGPDGINPYDDEVALPTVPSKMTMGTALCLILSQVGKGQATYVIRQSWIEIVPEKYTTSAFFLYQPTLAVTYEKRTLGEVLQGISDETGVAIYLDPSASEKAKTPISATFRNESLEDVLTPITEMAKLKYVALERSIYVTTPEHAKVIEKEEAVRRAKRKLAPLRPIQQKLESAASAEVR